ISSKGRRSICSRRADFTPFIEFIPSCIHPYHFDPGKNQANLFRIGGTKSRRINDSPKTKARPTHKGSHSVLEKLRSQLSPKSLRSEERRVGKHVISPSWPSTSRLAVFKEEITIIQI